MGIIDDVFKSVGDLASDKQFQDDVVTNAKKLAMVPEYSEYGKGAIPTEEELAKMSWPDLLQLRNSLTTRADQNAVAPYEHRAYAREFSGDPYSAAQNAIGSLGYSPAKGIIGGARSDPSFREIGQGLRGVWEGLTK